jgi:transposase
VYARHEIETGTRPKEETGMDYCGTDLHQDKTYVCILDDEGEVMERTTVRTTRRALSKYFKARGRMRVVMEAGGSSPWVSRLVERCGHEVLVCSPRRVRLIAESTLKADEVDAEVLARLVRIDPGFLGSVTHRSEEAQRLRSKLTVRTSLVETRTKWINAVKGILRGEGYRVAGGAPKSFPQRVAKLDLPADLRAVVDPLLTQLDLVNAEIDRREEDLKTVADDLPVVAHLRRIPGVGLIVALYYVLTIDDPERFRKSRDVAAYFGLRPTMRSSGNVSYFGRITREGDSEMRRLLVQAAHGLLRTRARCRLQDWTVELAGRRGKGKAIVALARKLAVLMHRLWVTGEVFQPYPAKAAA